MAGFLLHSRAARVLGYRLAVLGGLMFPASCLSPQAIEVTPAVPRQAPVIELAGVTPEQSPVCVDSTHPVNTFSLTVQSPDGLGLHARWFIDYNANDSTTQGITSDDVLTAPAAVSAGPAIFSVQLDMAQTGLQKKPGVHGLEVVIATEFSSEHGATPANRALVAGGLQASYKWVVNTGGTCE
jgi:hypothetical protein